MVEESIHMNIHNIGCEADFIGVILSVFKATDIDGLEQNKLNPSTLNQPG